MEKAGIICMHWHWCHVDAALLTISLPPIAYKEIQNPVRCLECNLEGNLGDFDFERHFALSGHTHCVKLSDPKELYCWICGDYQYSDRFDKALHRVRNPAILGTNHLKSRKLRKVSNSKVKISRGICNMGATCFMGAVLQVLLHNPLLISSQQMSSTYDRPCSKHVGNRPRSSSSISDSNSKNDCGNGHSSSTAHSSINGSDCCIACEVRKLFLEAAKTTSQALVPSQLLYSVWKYADYLAGYEQQDAHEFLIALFDGLDTHLNDFHTEKSLEYNETSESENMNIEIPNTDNKVSQKLIEQVFAGMMRSDVFCMHCGNRSCRDEPFFDISLSLEVNRSRIAPASPRSREKADQISITDCLDHFMSLENLTEEVMCSFCEQNRPAQKQLSLVSVPKVLVLHLKRFDAFNQRKIDIKVTFPPKNLNLAPFTVGSYDTERNKKRKNGSNHQHPSNNNNNNININSMNTEDRDAAALSSSSSSSSSFSTSISMSTSSSSSSSLASAASLVIETCSTEEEEVETAEATPGSLLYDLCGIVTHKGSLNQGHYIAYTSKLLSNANGNLENSWFKCDDENVTSIDEEDVEDAEGYLLFYIRSNVQ